MATYYVDPVSGNNANAGTSFATAFATTAKAETVVAAGDTVRLCATGTESLTGSSTITMTTSGGYATPIIWQGYNATGTAPLTAGNYYTIDGTSMTGSTDIVSTGSVQYRTISNVKFSNARRVAVSASVVCNYTIQFIGCSFVTPVLGCLGTDPSNSSGVAYYALNCVFTGSGAGGSQYVIYGAVANRGGVSCTGCLITGFNIVYSAGLNNGTEQYINNVYANNGTVVQGSVYQSTTPICGNVFYNNTYAIQISDRASTSRFYWITNNTFVNNTYALFAQTSATTDVNAYNHYYNNTNNYSGGLVAAGPYEIGGNPLFNAPGSLDFRLLSGSPLIGAGSSGGNIAGLSQIPPTPPQYSTIFGG